MTIAATYSQIVSMVSGTSGIALCVEELPLSLTEADLPCALVRVGPATWNEHASGLYRQVRTYVVDVYVRPVGEGVVPDEGYKACLSPMYNVGRTFVTDMTLSGTVDQVGTGDRPEFRDGGVAILTYAGQDYRGFSVTLEVTEKAS